MKQLDEELAILAAENIEKKKKIKEEGKEDPEAYSQEYRVKMYEEMKEQKDETERKKNENNMFKDFREFEEQNKRKGPPSVYNPQGELRQCNEGRYEFLMDESEDKTCLQVQLWLPKYMDTSNVNVDLNPLYVRVDVKGKITQLKFDEEILVEKSELKRSQNTGVLLIKCPKANISEIEKQIMKNKIRKEEQEKKDKIRKLD